jgi:hypothetical protein
MAKNQGVVAASMLAMALLLAAIPTGVSIYISPQLHILYTRALHHVRPCISSTVDKYLYANNNDCLH